MDIVDGSEMPRDLLSDADSQIIESILGLGIGVGLHRWIVQDCQCQAALLGHALGLPDAIPISDEAITGLSFGNRSGSSGCAVLAVDFDVFEAGNSYHLKSSGGCGQSGADAVIQDRVKSLFSLLRVGLLKAMSDEGEIRPVNWNRRDGVLVVRTSDLVFEDRMFHSVTLEARSAMETVQTSTLRKKGRPAKYDWDAIMRIVVTVANSPDGLPDTQADLIRATQEQYAITHGGEAPEASRLKEKLKRWLPTNWRIED